jgi:hypothetical protein
VLYLGMNKLIFFVFLTLLSCDKTPTIEVGDYIEKCVITSVKVRKPLSTIDFGVRYVYFTDCGTRHVTSRPAYKIGDTLTYVYKKVDKK